MSSLMTVHTLGPQLIALLGLPKHCISFELRCAVGEIVTVTCEYHPEEATGIDAVLAEYELVPRKPYRIEGHPGPELQDACGRINLTAQQMATGVRDLARHLAVTNAGGFDAWMRERTEAAHQAMMKHAQRGGIPYN